MLCILRPETGKRQEKICRKIAFRPVNIGLFNDLAALSF